MGRWKPVPLRLPHSPRYGWRWEVTTDLQLLAEAIGWLGQFQRNDKSSQETREWARDWIGRAAKHLTAPPVVQGEGPSDEGLAELKRIDANLRDKATPPRPDKGTCDTCGGGVVIQRTETTGRAVPCPTCGGPGLVRPRRGLGRLETCPTCNGVDPDPIKTGGGR